MQGNEGKREAPGNSDLNEIELLDISDLIDNYKKEIIDNSPALDLPNLDLDKILKLPEFDQDYSLD